jgi:uncharacterized protein YcbK (DUF882 family)
MSQTAEKELYRNNYQLSEHFNLSEFECSCCKTVKLDGRIVSLLQKIRERVNSPLHINSGYRCPKHNKDIGGSPTSQHMDGLAVDLACPSKITLVKFNDIAKECGAVRVGMYVASNFLHISVTDQHKNGVLCSRAWRIM